MPGIATSSVRVAGVAFTLAALGLTAPRPAAMVPVLGAEACSATGAPVEMTVPTAPSVTWTQASSGPPRFGNAAAFVPSRCTLVSFGGNVRGVYQGTTLLFDPAADSWTIIAAPTRRATSASPVARAFAAMDWDQPRSRVILFGGVYGPTLQDTWAFDPQALSWAQLAANCRKVACPPARWGHGMVWSSRLGQSVVFGGASGGPAGRYFDDVWAFGGSWRAIAPATAAHPVGRRAFGMAEDPTTGLILVYGGLGAADIPLADTWLLDPIARTWTRVVTPTTPDTSYGMAMGWVGAIGMIVMTGGSNSAQVATASTWAFDMTARDWVRVTATGAEPSGSGFGSTLTANPRDGSAILFGDPSGADGTAADTTWIVR